MRAHVKLRLGPLSASLTLTPGEVRQPVLVAVSERVRDHVHGPGEDDESVVVDKRVPVDARDE